MNDVKDGASRSTKLGADCFHRSIIEPWESMHRKEVHNTGWLSMTVVPYTYRFTVSLSMNEVQGGACRGSKLGADCFHRSIAEWWEGMHTKEGSVQR